MNMNRKHESLFEDFRAAELEEKRERNRERSGRITYDCYHALFPQVGDRVKCKLGHKISRTRDGNAGLSSVMSGRTSGFCRRCPDFNGDENLCLKQLP